MVQDHYLNHLEGGRRYISTSCLFSSSMPNNDDLFSEDDWNDFLPTKADEYDHNLSYLPDPPLPMMTESVIPKSEPMDDDWDSIISEAVKDSENKSLDLLEMALQESKATEPDFSPLSVEPVQFTFDPLNFALNQESLGSSFPSPPLPPVPTPPPSDEPPKKKKLTTAEILAATLEKNRTALVMKNASHLFRGGSDPRRAPFSVKNNQYKTTIIPSAPPSAVVGPVAKTSVIKLSKGSVILQIPPNIHQSGIQVKRSNPRSLLVAKKPPSSVSLQQQPKMVKILDPKTKTFRVIKLCAS